MDDGPRFEDWFSYCKGHMTYKTLIAGMKKPKKLLNPKNPLRNKPQQLPPFVWLEEII